VGVVSTQITILKVLAGHPEGRASIADLTRYVAILMSSGADWSTRMKVLAGRAPNLDIFTNGYVLREVGTWSITDLGRTFLASIEAPPASEPAVVAPEISQPVGAAVIESSVNVIQMEGHKAQLRRRAAA
jgi:hypothetical protein